MACKNSQSVRQKISKCSTERYYKRLSSNKIMMPCDGKHQISNKSHAESWCCDHL